MEINEQWEYCYLKLTRIEYHDEKKMNRKGWECGLTLCFMWKDIIIKEKLCEHGWIMDETGKMSQMYKQIWMTNPWEISFGLLGSLGWEMVSIQHGDLIDIPNYSVAYFKRIKRENENINEPKFMFPFQPEIWRK